MGGRAIVIAIVAWQALFCLPAAARTEAAAVGGERSGAAACDPFGPRFECGQQGMKKGECEDKGCCWRPAKFEGAPHVDLPWCFTSNAQPGGYRASQVEWSEDGSVHAALELSQGVQPEFGPDVKDLAFEARQLTPGVLRLRLTDPQASRWEVPRWLFRSQLLADGGEGKPGSPIAGDTSLLNLTVREDPFGIEVMRSGGKEGSGNGGSVLFNTTGTRLVFKDQYLELSTWLSPSATLFGAGERASKTLHLKRNGLPRPIWSFDHGPTFMEQNMYGSHPFVMALETDGSAWGMLLFSSNAMDIVPAPDRLSWRVTGGMLDMFLLAGPTPLDVMDQLTAVIGRPVMMPYWSLGWHQCKYGYQSVWEVEEVVANYSKAGLPLEVIWTDIDHMEAWKDFTFDPKNFPLTEMQRFVGDLHQKGLKWIPILDPGIKVEPGYAPYDEGLKEDAFMIGVDGKPYLGWVWPGPTHFPDWFLPRAQQLFARHMGEFRDAVPWDGICNFCTGDVCRLRNSTELRDDPPWVCQLVCEPATGLNDTQKRWLNPPYDVSNGLKRLPLGVKTMSVLASHHDGSVQYDTHQLYGLSECRAVETAVRDLTGKRPFVLSRASYLGAGAYAAHWTGDNGATWDQLALSIPGVLSIGLWGIPMAGADICGFQGMTTPELCARWAAMGAFYPFSRDHSDLHGGYQELYRWPEVAAAGGKALRMRYRLLPYLYTAMHSASLTGAPIMRPLWLDFPGDAATHTMGRQFMVGDALLVSPVLAEGAASVQAYFPRGTWHSLFTPGDVVDARAGGKTVEVAAPLEEVPVPLHMRGGRAVWMQQAALTTAEVKRSPLTAVIALESPLLVSATASAAAAGSAFEAGGPGRTQIVAHMFNDEGDELQVGTSLCNFLALNATFGPGASGSSSTHSAEVLLLFGSPQQLAASSSAGNGGGKCAAVGDHPASAAAAAPGGEVDWPELDGLEVLGWHLPVQHLAVEVVTRADSCGGLQAVKRLGGLDERAVSAKPGGLLIDLSPARHKLRCPYGLRLTWQGSSVPGAAAPGAQYRWPPSGAGPAGVLALAVLAVVTTLAAVGFWAQRSKKKAAGAEKAAPDLERRVLLDAAQHP